MGGGGCAWKGGGRGRTMRSAVPKIGKEGMNCNTWMCSAMCGCVYVSVTQGMCELVGF